MKLHIFIVLAVLLARTANAQSVVVFLPKYRVSAQYTQEFVLDGYVRVREWELVGDKMALRDLGMNTYSALQIRAGKELREKFRTYHRCLSKRGDNEVQRTKSKDPNLLI